MSVDNEGLQAKILEIAGYVDSFCKDHSITYYMMGGTALGAMRHAGFIPWDDDFDIFMDYENYQKFLAVAATELDEAKYYLQKENTEEWPLYFSKIRMNNTAYVEKELLNRKMHHGIYVDVMCLNNVSEYRALQYLQYYVARILSARAVLVKGYVARKKRHQCALLVAEIVCVRSVRKWMLNFVRSFNSKPSALVGHFFGRAPMKKAMFPSSFLSEPRLVPFESLVLPVAADVEGYLISRFGVKYMEMPSEEEKAKYPSHAFIVDLDKAYTP